MFLDETLLSGKKSYPKICWIPYDVAFSSSTYIRNILTSKVAGYSDKTSYWVANHCYFKDAPDLWTLREVIENQGYQPDRVKGEDGYMSFVIKFAVPVTTASSNTGIIVYLAFDPAYMTQYSNYSADYWAECGDDTQGTFYHYDSYLDEEDIWLAESALYVNSSTALKNTLDAPIKPWFTGDYLRSYLSYIDTQAFISSSTGWAVSINKPTNSTSPIVLRRVITINGIPVNHYYSDNTATTIENLSLYYHNILTVQDEDKYWFGYDEDSGFYLNPDCPTVQGIRESTGKTSIIRFTQDELNSCLFSPQEVTTSTAENIQSLVDLPIFKLGVVLH